MQKIDISIFKIFEIVIATFQVNNKLNRAVIIWETVLLTGISNNIVLKKLFLTLNNKKMVFANWKHN